MVGQESYEVLQWSRVGERVCSKDLCQLSVFLSVSFSLFAPFSLPPLKEHLPFFISKQSLDITLLHLSFIFI